MFAFALAFAAGLLAFAVFVVVVVVFVAAVFVVFVIVVPFDVVFVVVVLVALVLVLVLFVAASPQAIPKALNIKSVERAITFFIPFLILLSSSKD